jgi:hypothetical protein
VGEGRQESRPLRTARTAEGEEEQEVAEAVGLTRP